MIGTALVLGLLLGAIVWPLGRPRGRHRHTADPDTAAPAPAPAGGVGPFFASTRGRATATVGGLLVGGVFILVRQLSIMGSLDAVSQTYDNVFHLNATRHILRLQDGSAWTVGGMTQLEGQEGYYPALWHQAASLVTQLAGQDDIILASNVLMLAVAAVVWPLGLVALVCTTTSAGPLGWFLTGALAGVSALFPLALMSWGLLLPYLLSLALMPIAITSVVHLIGLAPPGRHRLSRPATLVLLASGCGAVSLAHPQGVFGGLVLGVPILLCATLVGARALALRRRRSPACCAFLFTAALTAVGMAGSSMLWPRARPGRGSAVWEPNASLRDAIGQTRSLSPAASPASLPMGVVVALTLFGVLLWTRS